MNEHIKRAMLNGRLVLLFGAGASIGCQNSNKENPPLGSSLAKILAGEMGRICEEDDELSDVYAASKNVLGEQLHKVLEQNYKHCKPSN